MWLDNLKEAKARTNMSCSQIAEATNLPERTISRIFSGKTPNPWIDTIHRISTALGVSLDEILANTKTVVGDQSLATLQSDIEVVTAERDLALAEKAILEDKVKTLTAELELLKMQLLHKDELLALHDYYRAKL